MEKAYQVNLEIFQGPMDLLLFLIRKKKIDIHNIPIAVITREYLQYLEKKDQINLERESEFLLIAALLIHIKSQMLLPRETEPEAEDPRRTLVDRLLDYQNIKAACSILRDKEGEELKKWKRFQPPAVAPEELEFLEVSLFDLAEIFFKLMKKKEKEPVRIIRSRTLSAKEKTLEIMNILREKSFLDFHEYFNCQETLEEALLAFFCLLEMIKKKTAAAVQDNLFHTIKVWGGGKTAA
ncbi:MAG: segregation and condensation protein A [Candidatus Aminicenantaceae bacterium]